MPDENEVKLYFGRKPEGAMSIDDLFIGFLQKHQYLIDHAVDDLVDCIKNFYLPTKVFHTFNPLIPNFMDDEPASQLMWMLGPDGTHIHMCEDEHMMEKLSFMGPGEVLCDDYRSFEQLPIKGNYET